MVSFRVRKMQREKKTNRKCKQDKNMTQEKQFRLKRRGKNNKNSNRRQAPKL